jgi:hypothetical protein
MPVTPHQHAVYRTALAIADTIDPSGRFRAILHLLRCSDGEQLEAVLSLRIDDVSFVRADPSADEPTGRTPAELCLSGRRIVLDEEAVAELRTYLRRRRRHVRFRLLRRPERSSVWYVHVICAGGHVLVSLGTRTESLARERLREQRRELARAARHRSAGLLFPAAWARHASVSAAHVRQWVNTAVGRGSPQTTRETCRQTRPVHRSHERRRRSADDGDAR